MNLSYLASKIKESPNAYDEDRGGAEAYGVWKCVFGDTPLIDRLNS